MEFTDLNLRKQIDSDIQEVKKTVMIWSNRRKAQEIESQRFDELWKLTSGCQ
jgi:hypothetical protein